MPLEGTIESFGISEIFQLISHQGKTGTLLIYTADGVARLRFSGGRLVEAWPDRRNPGELIGALLVRAGKITPTQLGHALQTQKQSLRKLGDILIRMGILRIKEFQEVLALQHRETVYRLLRLARGRFEFVAEPVEMEEGVSALMDVDSLLMEGFRQIDEWPKLTEKIPSERTIFTRAAAEPGGGLGPEESRVLALVDGVATVREVVDRACLGDFAGWEALCGLYDRGLIVRVASARRARSEPPSVRRVRLWDALAAAACLAAAAALLLLAQASGVPTLGRLDQAIREARAQARQVAARSALWRSRPPPAWPAPVEDGRSADARSR
ncbi:MAG: hypothetical protein Kow0092_26480 [Deferrisomatales bacterium]